MRRLKSLCVALAALAIVTSVVWAVDPSTFTSIKVLDDLEIVDDLVIGGDVTLTGDITFDDLTMDDLICDTIYATETGKFAGAVTCSTTLGVQGAATFDSTAVVSGTFKALTAAYFAKAVVCSSTLAATGGITGDITGDILGDVVGNITGDVLGDVNAAVVEVDTLKPGSGTAFNLRAYDGQDDADLNVYDVSATNDISAATATVTAGNFTTAEADTFKAGTGTAIYFRAADGHNDADINCAEFSGNLTGNVIGDLTGDVTAAVVITDTLKPTTGKATEFYIRAFDGQDDATINCKYFAGGLTGGVTGNVAGDLTGNVNAAIVEVDTLKPGSGTAFELRAYDGQDDADLNVYDVSATNDVGGATATFTAGNFGTAEADTFKAGSGTAIYFRAYDGHNDADINCADFSGDLTGNVTGNLAGNVNAAIVEADTLKPGSGTAFQLRAYDGQNDADLNVYDVSAGNDVSATTLTGALVGPACQSATYQGNLPTNSGGEHLGELWRNTVGDSLWYADNDSWVQLVP